MRKCTNISPYMRRPLVIHIWLCNCSILNFLIYEENLIFFFINILFSSILHILFYTILFYSILFYISGGERGQRDGRPLHLLSHNQPGLSRGFRDLELMQNHAFLSLCPYLYDYWLCLHQGLSEPCCFIFNRPGRFIFNITINILLFLKVQDFRILCGKIS
jgi:hypothetical protein